MVELTARERAIAEEASRKALADLLGPLGISLDNPRQDLGKLLTARALLDDEGFVEDLAFVRKLRTNTEKVTDAGIKAFVTVVVTSFLGLVLLGTKEWWLKHITG